MRINPTWRAKARLVLCGVLLLISGSLQAHAQSVSRDEEMALRRIVSLKLGLTTLAQTVKAISDQIGLDIHAAPYLKDRRLVVQIAHMRADAVIATLCELNGWTWTREDTGRYVVTHRKLPAVGNPAELVAAFTSILPADFASFLGINPSKSMPSDPGEQRTLDAYNKLFSRKIGALDDNTFLKDRVGHKVYQELEPKLADGKRVSTAELPDALKDKIVLILMFQALANTSDTVISGKSVSYQENLTGTVLELKEDFLMIGLNVGGSYRGFGAW